MTEMRLQKFLAHAGIGSRRQCETLITEGLVRVDDEVVTELGTKIDPAKNVVKFRGRVIRPENSIYILLNKPKGYVCTNDEKEKGKRVVDLLRDVNERLYPVGRLDKDSDGMILLTNDGEAANVLTHPRFEIEKTYIATVRGSVDAGDIEKLRKGVRLAEKKTTYAKVYLLHKNEQTSILKIKIKEGLNRQIRRMLARLGYKVRKLTRIGIGKLSLGKLKTGWYRHLKPGEVNYLRTLTEKKYDSTVTRKRKHAHR